MLSKLIAISVFNRVYPQDGQAVASKKNAIHYTGKIIALSFFGIPNRENPSAIGEADRVDARQVVKNLLGLNYLNNASRPRQVLHYLILAPLFALLNSFTIVAKTLFNSLRLLTEALPLLALTLLEERVKHQRLPHINKNSSAWQRCKNKAVIFSNAACILLLKSWYCLGRAITNPYASLHAALHYGYDASGQPTNRLSKLFGFNLNAVLFLLSAAIALTVYAILLPLTIKLLILKFPAILLATVHAVPPLTNIIINMFYFPGLVNFAMLASATLTMVIGIVAIDLLRSKFADYWFADIFFKKITDTLKQPAVINLAQIPWHLNSPPSAEQEHQAPVSRSQPANTGANSSGVVPNYSYQPKLDTPDSPVTPTLSSQNLRRKR